MKGILFVHTCASRCSWWRSFFSDSYNGSGYDSSDDDDDEDIEEEVKYSNLFPDKIKLKQDWKKAREEGDIMGKKLSAEVSVLY